MLLTRKATSESFSMWGKTSDIREGCEQDRHLGLRSQ
jgi:hypothetical protein